MHDTIAKEETNKVRRDSYRSEDLTQQLEGFKPQLGEYSEFSLVGFVGDLTTVRNEHFHKTLWTQRGDSS